MISLRPRCAARARTRSVCSIGCSPACLWPAGQLSMAWEACAKRKAEDSGIVRAFSHFSLVASRENMTFPPFSEYSRPSLGSTRAQECCLSDHQPRASRSGKSSYNAPRGPTPQPTEQCPAWQHCALQAARSQAE